MDGEVEWPPVYRSSSLKSSTRLLGCFDASMTYLWPSRGENVKLPLGRGKFFDIENEPL